MSVIGRELAEDMRWAADFIQREVNAQGAWDRADRLRAGADAVEASTTPGAVEALRLIAEDRVPYENPAVDTAVPGAVRTFARRAIGGQ